MFQDQALGGGKCHRQRVLSHRLGVAAAVGCHWHPLREFAQRNEVHATNHELDQPRGVQQLCLAGPQLFGGIDCHEDAGLAQRFGLALTRRVDGVVVGRIMKAAAAPVGQPWLWTLAFGQHEDRTPTHGYEPTREAAITAFARSCRRE